MPVNATYYLVTEARARWSWTGGVPGVERERGVWAEGWMRFAIGRGRGSLERPTERDRGRERFRLHGSNVVVVHKGVRGPIRDRVGFEGGAARELHLVGGLEGKGEGEEEEGWNESGRKIRSESGEDGPLKEERKRRDITWNEQNAFPDKGAPDTRGPHTVVSHAEAACQDEAVYWCCHYFC